VCADGVCPRDTSPRARARMVEDGLHACALLDREERHSNAECVKQGGWDDVQMTFKVRTMFNSLLVN